MKKISYSLLVGTIILLIVSCSNQIQHQLNPNMLPVTTKSDSAAIFYFDAINVFHYKSLSGMFEYYDKAIELDPDFFMAHTMKSFGKLFLRDTVEYENAVNLALNCEVNLNNAEKTWKKILEVKLADMSADVTPIAQEFVDQYPDIPEAHWILGFYYSQIGDEEKALELYEKALELSQNYAWAQNGLGYQLLALERYEEAEKAFDKYLEMMPDAPNAHDSKGDYYMAIGDYESAYECYTKAHELGWRIGKALDAKEKMEEAESPE